MRIDARQALCIGLLLTTPMLGVARAEADAPVAAPAPERYAFTPDLKLHHHPDMVVSEPAEDPLPGMPDAELDERERFLDAAIARNAHLTRIWHGMFTGGYALGFVVQASRAVSAQHRSPRFDLSYSAAKAAFGVVGRMARPTRAVLGPTPEELYPGDSHARRAERLLAAEAMLRLDAKQNDNRYKWYAHVINVVLNVTGGLVTGLVYHDWSRGITSLGIGIGVGELSIWTQPWQAKRSYKEYKARYGLANSSSGASLPASQPKVARVHSNGLLGFSF